MRAVFIGNSNVGKTSLISRITNPKTDIDTSTNTYLNEEFQIGDLTLVDTPGSEEFDRMRPSAYSSANCFLICFKTSDPNAFDDLVERWIPETIVFGPNVQRIFVGISVKSGNRDEIALQKNRIEIELGECFMVNLESAKEVGLLVNRLIEICSVKEKVLKQSSSQTLSVQSSLVLTDPSESVSSLHTITKSTSSSFNSSLQSNQLETDNLLDELDEPTLRPEDSINEWIRVNQSTVLENDTVANCACLLM